MAWHQPFDLYYWFVNVFAGSVPIFLAISFLVITFLAGMFRMNTLLVGVFFFLFIIMMAVVTQTLIYAVVIIAAVVIGYSLLRILKQ